MGWLANIRKKVGHETLVVPHSCVFLFNLKNEILLQLRKDDDTWSFHGGSIEIDESVEEAAVRELLEETGIVAEELLFFKIYSGKEAHHTYPNGDDLSAVDISFIVTKYKGGPVIDKIEVKDLSFFSENELPENISPKIRKRILEAFRFYNELSRIIQ